jgi:hypothetical protein
VGGVRADREGVGVHGWADRGADAGIAATMRWPGFRAAARALGLRASLSIPLFAGSGASIAVLNLYGHERDTMAPLQKRIGALYQYHDPGPTDPDAPPLDPGGEQLLAGLTEAFAVQATIQRAVDIISRNESCTLPQAYMALRLLAMESGAPLTLIAAIAAME